MNEFKDQREAYNTGLHDAVAMTKHWINKFKLTTVDQIYIAMGEVLANHQYRQLNKTLTDAIRTKTGDTRLAQNDQSSERAVLKNEREKKMEISDLVLDQTRGQTQYTSD